MEVNTLLVVFSGGHTAKLNGKLTSTNLDRKVLYVKYILIGGLELFVSNHEARFWGVTFGLLIAWTTFPYDSRFPWVGTRPTRNRV